VPRSSQVPTTVSLPFPVILQLTLAISSNYQKEKKNSPISDLLRSACCLLFSVLQCVSHLIFKSVLVETEDSFPRFQPAIDVMDSTEAKALSW
jgi:hypothetical protein